MCNVCEARLILEAREQGQTVVYGWEEGGIAVSLEIEAEAEGPEFKPGRFRFRRGQEPWLAWMDTSDLAGSVGSLDLEIVPEYKSPAVRAWVRGGDVEPVLGLLRRGNAQAHPAE